MTLANGNRAGPCLRRHRIALYSHDTMGIGHTRRNLLIAQTLASSLGKASILLITGTREASAFPMPPGADCLTLPSLHKDVDGRYCPRSLGVSLGDLINLRARTIWAAIETFDPDVLIVDKEPHGALGELDLTLEHLRSRVRAHCVLGLRDVLDEPEVVRAQWRAAGNEEAISTYYNAVWVYGDPAVYDPVREYRFGSAVAARVRYVGYLDPRARLESSKSPQLPPALADLPGRLMLCLVGGGQDGAGLAEAFAKAELPPGTGAVIVTGPFMPAEVQERLHRRARECPRLRIVPFFPEPGLLLRLADRVVAMGGYNTVCEILAHEKHALIVPRVRPRREQFIRAERLSELNLVDILHPDQLRPRALSEWLARDLGPPPRARERINFNGTACLPRLLSEVLAGPFEPVSVRLREKVV